VKKQGKRKRKGKQKQKKIRMEKSVVISFEGKTLPTSFYSFPNLFPCYLSAARRGEVEEES